MATKKVLIVEDSKFFSNLIEKKIYDRFDFECMIAGSMSETEKIVADYKDEFFIAIVDLNLPGSPNGESVEYIMGSGIPTIVLTSLINDSVRDRIMSLDIFDYIYKEGPQSLDLIITAIDRFIRNEHISILLVDDSDTARKHIRKILEKQNLRIYEAGNGKEALLKLSKIKNIQLVITDYNMPEMDGFELTKAIRSDKSIDEIAIIGISASGNPLLSAKFLKTGANDFVSTPFHKEEFLWRVIQSIDMLENVKKLKDAAVKDHMTKLYNRRYFFENGKRLYKGAAENRLKISIGMIDIDHFKRVNDAHGHDAGDLVITHVGRILEEHFRSSDIVARYGGEEFVVLTLNMDLDQYLVHFENIRLAVEKKPVKVGVHEIKSTVSIGVTTRLGASLDDMIKDADTLLYQAKKAGRNCVRIK